MLRRNHAFRDDIQGMRALAVGLVILAHAGFGTVAGGFIGVDLFFVVSGYLIIGLLLREAQERGRTSVTGFYARRARRILPAASLVLVVTLAVAAWEWSLLRVSEVVKDVVWSAFFAANFRFTSVETDYFASGEPPSPVQHYWSLAVEEQFYLVIPFVVLIVTAAVRGGVAAGNAVTPEQRRRLRRWLALALLAISAASLLWSVVLTENDRTTAYFSTPARAWELGAGGLAAMVVSDRGRRLLRRWQAELLGWAGLALVLWAAVSYDATTAFPGVAAAVPVLGAALMLVVGATEAGAGTLFNRALSVRPLTLIGAWSFSLYLWHWPVLQFAESHWGRPLTHPRLAAVLLLTLGLSVLSYYLVEEPFRRGVTWRPARRALLLYPVSLAVVLGGAWAGNHYVDRQIAEMAGNPSIVVSDYDQARLSDDPTTALVQASLLAADEGHPVPGALRPQLGDVRESIAPLGECDYREGMRRLCPTGDPDADRVIVVTGDSHARAWGPAFTRIGEQHGYRVYHLVYSGCPANTATRADPADGGDWPECEEFKAWVLDQVKELRPEAVVVANNAYRSHPFVDVQDEGLAEELAELRKSADRVTVVGNMPVVSRMPGVCLATRDADLGTCVQEPHGKPRRMQRAFADIAAAQGARFVDVHRWFCDHGRCPAVIGDYVSMRDKDHVTVEYAEELAAPLAEALGLDAPGGGPR